MPTPHNANPTAAARRTTVTIGAVVALILVAGCASGAPATSEPPETVGSDHAGETTQDSSAEGSVEYLDELYSESLHDGVPAAEPGTAYIAVAGERYEFESLTCTITDEPDRGQFIVVAGGETTNSGHKLYLSRQIGSGIGFAFEEEHVQLALLDTDGGEGKMSNSMAQHQREQGEPAEWMRGSGTHPLVRVVGNEATASGVLDGVPFAPNPAEAEFTAAATCP